MKNWIFAIIVLLGGSLFAQEESLVTVLAKMPNGDIFTGTGAVFEKIKDAPSGGYYSRIITVAHVVEEVKGKSVIRPSTIDLLYPDGTKVERARIIVTDKEKDVAVLEGWTPNKIQPIPLGEGVKEGDEIFIYSPRGVRRTKISVADDDSMYADIFFVSGESGSPVLNSQKQIVGVVSGGHSWFEKKKFKIRVDVRQNSGEEERVGTWPGMMPHIFTIKNLLQKVKK